MQARSLGAVFQVLALASVALACRSVRSPPGTSPASQVSAASSRSTTTMSRTGGARTENAAPAKAGKRIRGWQSVDTATYRRIDAFARDYVAYLGEAKTARKTVTELVEVFRQQDAIKLSKNLRPPRTPGSRFYFVGQNGDAAAFVRLGRRPLERGARIVIAAVEAPHIQLKQRPVYEKAGVAVFDTVVHGRVDMPSWLSRPLALHIYLARPGAQDGGLDVVIGEAADDPVLVIPDLLPHLSRKVQRNSIVDTPERLDAIAARSRRALLDALAGHGVEERSLAEAEVALVPAGRPVFVGVDRARIAGHGHGGRTLAYAAVRALADAHVPERAAVVIVVRSASYSSGSNSGFAFVDTAMSRLLGALTEGGAKLDMLDTRRVYARSSAWVTGGARGAMESGLILTPLSDDALPRATRRVIDELERVGAPYQFDARAGWSVSRSLMSLDIEVVDVSMPTVGGGAPTQLLSTLDLYHAWLSATAWLGGAR